MTIITLATGVIVLSDDGVNTKVASTCSGDGGEMVQANAITLSTHLTGHMVPYTEGTGIDITAGTISNTLTTLASLSDTDIDTPSDFQNLQFNGTDWVNTSTIQVITEDNVFGDWTKTIGTNSNIIGYMNVREAIDYTTLPEYDANTIYAPNTIVKHMDEAFIRTDHSPTSIGQTPAYGSAFWDVVWRSGEAWDSSTHYYGSWEVVHNGILYSCSVEHTNQEPPNETYWESMEPGAKLISSGKGSMVMGCVDNRQCSSSGSIQATGDGSFSGGYADGNDIFTSGMGSFSYGWCSGDGFSNLGRGCILMGFCDSTMTANTEAKGAVVMGYVTSGGMSSNAKGSFALGYSSMGIAANGDGSFAMGYAASGSISATAAGALQFGPGTNGVTDSMQIGTYTLITCAGKLQHTGAQVVGVYNYTGNGTYTCSATDYCIWTSHSSTKTVKLPSSPTIGRTLKIKNTGAGNLTIDRNSMTINGATSNLTVTTGNYVTLVATSATNWEQW